MIRINDYNQTREFLTNAVIKTIAGADRFNKKKSTKHPNGTPYRIATAEVEYPNGTKAIVGTSIFSESLKTHPESFAVGQTVQMAVQMDGEYAGYSRLQLPELARFDVSTFEGMEATAPAVGEVQADI